MQCVVVVRVRECLTSQQNFTGFMNKFNKSNHIIAVLLARKINRRSLAIVGQLLTVFKFNPICVDWPSVNG